MRVSAWLYNYARSEKRSFCTVVQFNNLINYMITRPNPQMTSSKRKESIWILNQRSHSTNILSIQIDTKQNQIVLLESLHLHLQHSNWYWATSNCPYGVTPFTSPAFKLILYNIKLSCMVIRYSRVSGWLDLLVKNELSFRLHLKGTLKSFQFLLA